MKLNNQKGYALVMGFYVTAFLLVYSAAFVLRASHEWGLASRQRLRARTVALAEAGAEDGLRKIDEIINTDMLAYINSFPENSDTVTKKTQRVTKNKITTVRFLKWATKDQDAGGNFISQLAINADDTIATYQENNVAFGPGTYDYTITITSKGSMQSVGPEMWDLPYSYEIEAEGDVDGFTRQISFSGDFTVRVQHDNFARYALFTNEQSTPSGSRVWFTDNTIFYGPIHTNDRFNFAHNPSGIFYGEAVQHEQTARYYNNGSNTLLDADFNGVRDVPTFHAGFDRGESEIVIASAGSADSMREQATNFGSYGSNGIYIPNNGTSVLGGVYVKGDAAVALSVDGSDRPVYTLTQGGTTKIITVDLAANQTIIQDGASSETLTGVPDGTDELGNLIFVDGNITSLGGTIQGGDQLTVSAQGDVVITDNVVYQNYTPGTGSPGDADYVAPSVVGYDNLLGIVAWGDGNSWTDEDVIIGTSAPDNLNIHASIFVEEGIFTVQDYTDQGVGPRGKATLIGGVVSDKYGAFGLFSGATGAELSGYGRNFVYDERMRSGISPPYFPTLQTFIAFSNDITDKVIENSF